MLILRIWTLAELEQKSKGATIKSGELKSSPWIIESNNLETRNNDYRAVTDRSERSKNNITITSNRDKIKTCKLAIAGINQINQRRKHSIQINHRTIFLKSCKWSSSSNRRTTLQCNSNRSNAKMSNIIQKSRTQLNDLIAILA